ncbi:MAG: PIG-L family deacetylase [Clostridiales bacterium]|nr:PIG-L family deacetylase [Clostridiales bacterium]
MDRNLNIHQQKRILIVAPHPDDESIGCGGLLALYGKQCDILLLTDGSKGHASDFAGDEGELVKIREQELKNAAELAEVQEVHMLRIPDGDLFSHYNVVKKIDIRSYDYVFVPNRREAHEDHRVSYRMLKKLKKEQRAKAILVEYEVWTPLVEPTCFLDISEVIDRKRRLIEQHESQIGDIDYASKGVGLSCYRGIHINVDYAEAYYIEKQRGIVKHISSRIPKAWKRKIKRVLKKS